MKNKVLFLGIAILGAGSLQAQVNVGSTSAPDPSAILQATSTTKGFLPPSMTTTQQGNISNPATGLIIYNNTLNQLQVNVGTPVAPVWTVAGGANAAWSATGNTGTVPGTNYLGTTDNAAIGFRTNGVERMRIDSVTGYVGIGTGNPYAPLQFANNLANKKIVLWDNTPSIANDSAFFGFGINAGTLRYQVPTGSSHNFFSNKTKIASINSAGSIAISGTAPTYIYFDATRPSRSGQLYLTGGLIHIWHNQYGNVLSADSIGNVTIYNRLSMNNNNNIFVGAQAGLITTAQGNTFLGISSGISNTTGASNTFTGFQSGFKNVSGNNNVFNGHQSGYNTTTGVENTFNGFQTGFTNTIGTRNLFTGSFSGYSNTTGVDNVFNGWHTGYNNSTGNGNAFIGPDAGLGNTTGSSNISIGLQSGYFNQTGVNNISIGYQSGYSNTASNNQFIGFSSGFSTTTGIDNTFSGFYSGYANTVGTRNLFSGTVSGRFNTTGVDNTFIGWQSGYLNTAANQNNFIGAKAGVNTTTGGANNFIGYNAGANNITGAGNVAIGDAAGPNQSGLINTIVIGQGAIGTASNSVVLGNNSITAVGGFAPYTNLSDARFKYNIKANVLGLAFIQKLRPVTYQLNAKKLDAFSKNGIINANFTEDNNATMHTGFLAQDVEKVADELGISFDGIHKPENDRDHYSLAYAQFVVPLVKAVQEQQEQIEILTKQNKAMAAQLADVKDMRIAMAAMQTELNKIAVVNKIAANNTAIK